MSPEEQETIRQRLRDLKAELLSVEASAKDAAKPVELDQAKVGRLSRMDAMQAQAMSQEANRRREVQLQRIEAALLRLDQGKYGICLKCGDAVDTRRLESDPTVFLCLNCAQQAGA